MPLSAIDILVQNAVFEGVFFALDNFFRIPYYLENFIKRWARPYFATEDIVKTRFVSNLYNFIATHKYTKAAWIVQDISCGQVTLCEGLFAPDIFKGFTENFFHSFNICRINIQLSNPCRKLSGKFLIFLIFLLRNPHFVEWSWSFRWDFLQNIIRRFSIAKYIIAAFPFIEHVGRTFNIFKGVFAGSFITGMEYKATLCLLNDAF